MNAVRLIRPRHPLELQNVARPVPGAGEALVRVKAAGICHSDVHYRAGKSRVDPLPLTLGHEVSGVIEEVGPGSAFRAGDRVCVHYLATCGQCGFCVQGEEQFCARGKMMGKLRDGGYAEFVVMPERSLFPLPQQISFEHGAVMMCSSATAFHALRKARLREGETVAVFGAGGLGLSAVQIANALGAARVYAVDIDPRKLAMAAEFGAAPINAREEDPVFSILRATGGVDVSLELIGLPLTMRQALLVLGIKGRAALAGITQKTFEVGPYADLINKEAEIIGVSDHLAGEIPALLDFATAGKLDLSRVITRRVPLQAGAINETLDRLEKFQETGRVVIIPEG